jgi:hypothetical protein
MLWVPPVTLNPSFVLLGYKLSSRHHIRVWVLFNSIFYRETYIFYCNCDVESFYYESGPPFLFYTCVAISLFVFRDWTPYSSLLHTHLQF